MPEDEARSSSYASGVRASVIFVAGVALCGCAKPLEPSTGQVSEAGAAPTPASGDASAGPPREEPWAGVVVARVVGAVPRLVDASDGVLVGTDGPFVHAIDAEGSVTRIGRPQDYAAFLRKGADDALIGAVPTKALVDRGARLGGTAARPIVHASAEAVALGVSPAVVWTGSAWEKADGADAGAAAADADPSRANALGLSIDTIGSVLARANLGAAVTYRPSVLGAGARDVERRGLAEKVWRSVRLVEASPPVATTIAQVLVHRPGEVFVVASEAEPGVGAIVVRFTRGERKTPKATTIPSADDQRATIRAIPPKPWAAGCTSAFVPIYGSGFPFGDPTKKDVDAALVSLKGDAKKSVEVTVIDADGRQGIVLLRVDERAPAAAFDALVPRIARAVLETPGAHPGLWCTPPVPTRILARLN